MERALSRVGVWWRLALERPTVLPSALLVLGVGSTVFLVQPEGSQRLLAGAITLVLAAALGLRTQLWNLPVWRRLGGPAGAVLIGLLVATTGGHESYYQDALLVVPLLSALVLPGRLTALNLGVTLLVGWAPVVYQDVPGSFVPDVIHDSLLWAGVTAAVFGQTAVLRHERRQLHRMGDLRTRFLEAVSHQLRTPVTGVVGATSTLVSRRERLSADQRERLEDVAYRHALRLDALVANVVDVAQLADPKVELRQVPTDVDELVSEAAEAVDATDHELQLNLEPATVFADRRQLRRAIYNVVENAVVHTPPHTRVVLTTRSFGGAVTILVADDGPGVPPELGDAVFDPLVRGPVAADPNPGIGIGLAISRTLIELHGGTLSLRERPGGGTAVFIELPTVPSRPRRSGL